MRAARIVLGSIVAAAVLFSGSAHAKPAVKKCKPWQMCTGTTTLADALMAPIENLAKKKAKK